ncbi:hypothetical protein [Aetokthonos hydrillicola]|jgi:hypothetical protein|nr:hypothetical protein [Aetokthonos hydrillicola]MBO3457793.1 hypothetical protein [Aetokthonos hydrillicola CCALA 1050]
MAAFSDKVNGYCIQTSLKKVPNRPWNLEFHETYASKLYSKIIFNVTYTLKKLPYSIPTSAQSVNDVFGNIPIGYTVMTEEKSSQSLSISDSNLSHSQIGGIAEGNLNVTQTNTVNNHHTTINLGQDQSQRTVPTAKSLTQLGPTAGFPCYADPEYAVMYNHARYRKFIYALECQLKLHLLMNVHILIPGGYFFDNPGLWNLITVSEGLKTVLLSSPHSLENNKTTLVIAKHEKTQGINDETELDAIFRTWFAGSDGKRINNPSCLRTAWIDRINNDQVDLVLSNLRQESKSITISNYANSLSLNALTEALPSISFMFEKASSIKTPSSRHTRFFEEVKSILDKDVDFEGRKELVNFLDQIENKKISRSEIQKFVPSAWNSIKNNLIAVRQSCYFDNYEGYGQISVLPNTGVNISNQKIIELWKELDIWLSISPVNDIKKWAVAIDKLSFEEILEIRKHQGFMASLRKLYLTYTLSKEEQLDAFLSILRDEWAPQLIDATQQVTKYRKREDRVIIKRSIKDISEKIPSILSDGASIISNNSISIPTYTRSQEIIRSIAHQILISLQRLELAKQSIIRCVRKPLD